MFSSDCVEFHDLRYEDRGPFCDVKVCLSKHQVFLQALLTTSVTLHHILTNTIYRNRYKPLIAPQVLSNKASVYHQEFCTWLLTTAILLIIECFANVVIVGCPSGCMP